MGAMAKIYSTRIYFQMAAHIVLGVALTVLGSFGLLIGGLINYWMMGIAGVGAAAEYYLGYLTQAEYTALGNTANLFYTRTEYFVAYAAVALSISGGITASVDRV